MNRKKFIKSLGAGALVVAVAPLDVIKPLPVAQVAPLVATPEAVNYAATAGTVAESLAQAAAFNQWNKIDVVLPATLEQFNRDVARLIESFDHAIAAFDPTGFKTHPVKIARRKTRWNSSPK